MIESELDIPSLTENGIQMGHTVFYKVKELNSSSMFAWLIIFEMLILLIDSFDRKPDTKGLKYYKSPILQASRICVLSNTISSWTINEFILFVRYQSQ